MDDGFCGLDPRAWIRFSVKGGSDHKGSNGRRVNFQYLDELRSLSQTNFKLTLEPTQGSRGAQDGKFAPESKKSKRPYWIKGPLPQLASFRCVPGSVPKIKVRNSIDVGGGNKRNPVFRSNSFRYEKYSKNGLNLDSETEKSALNFNKVSQSNIRHFSKRRVHSGLAGFQRFNGIS